MICGHDIPRRGIAAWGLAGALFAAAIASAQPGPVTPTPAVAPTRAPIFVNPSVIAATPTPAPTPDVPVTPVMALGTAGTATGTETPVGPVTPSGEVATPEQKNLVALEPGADKALALPAYSGDPTTALGSETIYLSLSPMRRAWFLREYYRQRGDAPKAALATETLLELRLDSGLENATSIAAALAAEARALQTEKKGPEAIAAAETATKLAPDYTTAWTTLARVHLGAVAIGPAFGAIEGAVRAASRNLRTKVRILGNAGLAALGGVFLCYAIFLLVAFIRHARFVAHDFRHALADNMPAWLAAIILLPFLVFPLVFGVGPFALLAWWSLVLWIKLTLRERIVVALFLVFGAASPFLFEKAALPFSFEGGDTARLYTAIHEDELSARDYEDLEAIATETKDANVLVTLAIAHERKGRYSRAKELFEAAQESGGGTAALIGLGNVHYALGDHAGAIAMFEKVLAAGDGASLAAHFNLSQIYAERTELTKATESLESAKKIDAEACERFLRNKLTDSRRAVTAIEGQPPMVAAAYANRFLMTRPVQDSALLARAAVGAPSIAARTWATISPAIPLPAITGIFVAVLVLCGIVSAVFRRVLPSRPCTRCGRMLCLRCDGPPLEEDICTQCFHAFVENEGVDPRQRAAKEMEIQNHHHRRGRRRKLFSRFVPGAGQIFAGETVRGVILLLLACLFGFRAAAWGGWFRPAYPVPGMITQIAASALAAFALVVVWIFAQRAAPEPPAGPSKGFIAAKSAKRGGR